MKNLFLSVAFLAALVMGVTSCKKPQTEEIPVSDITVSPTTGSVVVGQTLTLTAEVLPKNTTDKKLIWGTRNPEFVSVENGVVTGIASGEAEVWVRAGDSDKTAAAMITVTPAPIRVATVTMNKTELPLFVGKSEKLTFTLDPTNATDQTAVWKSGKPEFAEVATDGTVTAKAEGKTTITVTVDEKTATCEVTVSIPEISDIKLPYLKDIEGNTVAMEAQGFKAGDKIAIASYFGFEETVDVKNVTADGAEFDLPQGATKDRSYTLALMRDGAKKAEAVIRYDDDMVHMNKSLGWAITGPGQVTEDGSGVHGGVTRGGYVSPASVFTYSGTFDASAADLKLCTFTPGEPESMLDLDYVFGPENLDALKYFDMSGVKKISITDNLVGELDMRMFPNCETLLGWGDPGQGPNRIKKFILGEYGKDPLTKLKHVQLERNVIEGEIDMRQMPDIYQFSIQDNKITALNFGTANTDKVNLLPAINAERNQIREFSIENCGVVRTLLLGGNPIERLTLLNNSTQPGSNQWMYVYKGYTKDSEGKGQSGFTFDPVSAENAVGERVINVEQYWWRVFSQDNANEVAANNLTEFEGGWVAGNPVVKALAAGYKVVCWTYHTEVDKNGVGGDAHRIEGHEHAGGSEPCTY